MDVVTEINLDMNRSTIRTIEMVQGDGSSRKVKINLFSNGVPWTPPTGWVPIIRYQKMDTLGGFYDVDDNGESAISVSGSSITITVCLQALTTVGRVAMSVNFYSPNNTKVSTFAFGINVKENPMLDRTILSGNYYNALTELASDVVRAAQKLPGDVSQYVSDWLDENITVETGVAIDASLTVAGAAADAKAAGQRINSLETELGSSPLVISTGNFVGTNIWETTNNTWLNIARTPILENFGNCVVRSTVPGVLLTVFYAEEVNTGTELVRKYDKVSIDSVYNYIRIRIQPGTSGITDFTPYLDSLIVIETNDGLIYRVSTNESDIETIDEELGNESLVISTGNFVGSNIWENTNNTWVNIARTPILENFGNCVIRSTVPGVLLTVFYAEEVNTGTELVRHYDKVSIDSVYNYIRIRIQPGTSGITDFTPYLDSLLALESSGGLSYRVSKNESDIVNIQKSISESHYILALDDVEYTENTAFEINVSEYDPRNIIAFAEAKYTGEGENPYLRPTIAARSGVGAYSEKVFLGDKDEWRENQVRFYPFYKKDALTLQVSIVVPTGITLYIKTLRIMFEENIDHVDATLHIDYHSGSRNVPQFSKRAINQATRVGAKSIIELPKRSSDGVWFCYHDDSFDIATTFLRNSDGSTISSSQYQGLPFSQIPFSYLEQFDWGISNNAIYAGEKGYLLSEFFKACAKLGIHPMLSCHPASQSTGANLREIKAMAKKYGVLKNLTLKFAANSDAVETLGSAFNIFGYEIEGYIANVVAGGNVASVITHFDELNIDKTKVCCTIEQFAGSSTLNATTISAILDAGYEAGVAQADHTRVDGTTSSKLNAVDYEYYSNLGVTRFTSGTFLSYGLNW